MFIPIRELGSVGVVSDLPDYDLPPNAFSVVQNIRFHNGVAETHPDPVIVNSTVDWDIQADARELAAWVDRNNTTQFAYSTEDSLYWWDGDSWEAADTTYKAVPNTIPTSDRWTSVVFGDTVIFNSGGANPLMLENGSTQFALLDGWTADDLCISMRKFKNFLVAMGTTIASSSDGFSPNKILWSDASITNEVPDSWDITDTAGLAGDKFFGADDGSVVDGLELGDVFIVYTKKSIYEMSFIGAPRVMAFRKISNNTLLDVGTVVAYDNYHFCVGEQEIYVHDGQTIQHITDQRVRKQFFSELVDKTTVRLEHNPITKEIFVLYSTRVITASNKAANRALVWCYRYNTFSFVDMPSVASIKFGYKPPASATDTWTDYATTPVWTAINSSWSQLLSTELDPALLLLSEGDDKIYQSDVEFLPASTQSAFVERTGIDLDQLAQSTTNTVKMVRQILPQIKGIGGVTFELGCSNSPNSTVEWSETQAYDLETDYRVDLFVTGRYLAYRITGDQGSNFELSGMDVDFIEVGER